MVNPLDAIMKWGFDNVFILCILGLAFYFLHGYLGIKKVEKIKSVDRSEIERQNMVERLKFNTNKRYKWLYKGSHLLGNISSIIGSQTGGNPHPVETLTIAFQPMLISSPIKIKNPFAKKQVVVIDYANILMTSDENGNVVETNKIIIKDTIAISKYQGIYYTVGSTEEMIKNNIRDFDTFKTDLNNLASIFFVKSQEQSTYQPQYAHDLALKEKEIQLEMAKKKGKMETI
jgi:hypothetical protein